MTVAPANSSEETILALFATGMFSVGQDGSIWRHRIRTRWGDRSVTARRADHKFGNGYLYVSVTIGYKQVAVPAHRLVWCLFNGPIPADREINHKNGDRADNRLENLEVVTPSQNIRHSYDTLHRPRHRRSKFNDAKRAEVLRLRAAGLSYRQISKITFVSPRTAIVICRNGPSPDDELPLFGAAND